MLLYSLTSSVLLTKIREPPDVAEAHAEPEDGEEELDGAVPGHPGLPRPLLTVHHKDLKLVKTCKICKIVHYLGFTLDGIYNSEFL